MRSALRALAVILAVVIAAVIGLDFIGSQEEGPSISASDPPLRTVLEAPSTTTTTEEPVTTTQPQIEVPPVAPRVVREPPADVWDRLAQCESGGDWSLDSDNGFSGGLQIAGHLAGTLTREQQIEWAIEIQGRQGWNAWPSCSSRLGLR